MPYEIDNFNHSPHTIPDATPGASGVMSPADKVKLDSLSPGGGNVRITFQVTLALLQSAGAVKSTAIPLAPALPAGARFVSLIIGEGNFTALDDPTHDRARATFQGLNQSTTQIAGQMLIDATDAPKTPQALGFPGTGNGGGPGGAMSKLSGVVPTLFVAMDNVNLNTLTAGAFSVDFFYTIVT